MKMLEVIICILCAILILASCSGAGGKETGKETQPMTDEEILAQRRDIAEAKMRQMATVLWRASEDIVYTKLAGGEAEVKIVAGRLYQGLPYTHAGGTELGFLDYAVSKDEKGIYTISGLNHELLNGGGNNPRLSNDCSAAVLTSWNMIGYSFAATATKTMAPNMGCIRVGEYESNPVTNNNTKETTKANGEQTMYKAYAQLQKADAVVNNNDGAGHTMMITKVILHENDGVIDGDTSKVLVLDQTSILMRQDACSYDEELGENVYQTYGVDREFSFKILFDSGYLPITCKELVDPSPVAEASVRDSEENYTKDNIFKGRFTANRYISDVTITITDSEGKEVQKITGYALRSSWRSYDLNTLLTENSKVHKGSLDPNKLVAGTYHCTHVCRLADGREFTMRDFHFTV